MLLARLVRGEAQEAAEARLLLLALARDAGAAALFAEDSVLAALRSACLPSPPPTATDDAAPTGPSPAAAAAATVTATAAQASAAAAELVGQLLQQAPGLRPSLLRCFGALPLFRVLQRTVRARPAAGLLVEALGAAPVARALLRQHSPLRLLAMRLVVLLVGGITPPPPDSVEARARHRLRVALLFLAPRPAAADSLRTLLAVAGAGASAFTPMEGLGDGGPSSPWSSPAQRDIDIEDDSDRFIDELAVGGGQAAFANLDSNVSAGAITRGDAVDMESHTLDGQVEPTERSHDSRNPLGSPNSVLVAAADAALLDAAADADAAALAAADAFDGASRVSGASGPSGASDASGALGDDGPDDTDHESIDTDADMQDAIGHSIEGAAPPALSAPVGTSASATAATAAAAESLLSLDETSVGNAELASAMFASSTSKPPATLQAQVACCLTVLLPDVVPRRAALACVTHALALPGAVPAALLALDQLHCCLPQHQLATIALLEPIAALTRIVAHGGIAAAAAAAGLARKDGSLDAAAAHGPADDAGVMDEDDDCSTARDSGPPTTAKEGGSAASSSASPETSPLAGNRFHMAASSIPAVAPSAPPLTMPPVLDIPLLTLATRLLGNLCSDSNSANCTLMRLELGPLRRTMSAIAALTLRAGPSAGAMLATGAAHHPGDPNHNPTQARHANSAPRSRARAAAAAIAASPLSPSFPGSAAGTHAVSWRPSPGLARSGLDGQAHSLPLSAAEDGNGAGPAAPAATPVRSASADAAATTPAQAVAAHRLEAHRRAASSQVSKFLQSRARALYGAGSGDAGAALPDHRTAAAEANSGRRCGTLLLLDSTDSAISREVQRSHVGRVAAAADEAEATAACAVPTSLQGAATSDRFRPQVPGHAHSRTRPQGPAQRVAAEAFIQSAVPMPYSAAASAAGDRPFRNVPLPSSAAPVVQLTYHLLELMYRLMQVPSRRVLAVAQALPVPLLLPLAVWRMTGTAPYDGAAALEEAAARCLTLVHETNSEVAQALLAAMPAPACVSLFLSASVPASVRELAAAVLRYATDERGSLTVKDDITPAQLSRLAQLLEPPARPWQRHAVWILRSASAGGEKRKEKVFRFGCHVPDLVALLTEGPPLLQKEVTALFKSLTCQTGERKDEIYHALNLPRLAALLETDLISLQEHAAGLLRNLTHGDDERKQAVFAALHLTRVMELLQSDNHRVLQSVTGLLQNLCTRNEERREVIFQHLDLASIVRLMEVRRG